MTTYDWLIQNEDETWTVKGKKQDYVLQELEGDKILNIFTLANKSGGNINPIKLLVSRSIIKPKLSDEEVGKIKGSDFFRLMIATKNINGLEDFSEAME